MSETAIMVTEYTKPWNDCKVWFDSDKKIVVLKRPGESVYKFDESYSVDFICDNFDIFPFEKDEIADALKEAFNELAKLHHPFLCPACEYGCLFRIFHGKDQYICKRRSERKDKEPSPNPLYGDGISILIAPEVYNRENGHGGWDGKQCPNYIKKPQHSNPEGKQ